MRRSVCYLLEVTSCCCGQQRVLSVCSCVGFFIFIFKGIGSRSNNISLVDSQVEVFYSILSKLWLHLKGRLSGILAHAEMNVNRLCGMWNPGACLQKWAISCRGSSENNDPFVFFFPSKLKCSVYGHLFVSALHAGNSPGESYMYTGRTFCKECHVFMAGTDLKGKFWRRWEYLKLWSSTENMRPDR